MKNERGARRENKSPRADIPEAKASAEQAIIPKEPDRHAQPVDAYDQPPRLAFPVVGIGASAGGLEAFTELFKALPPDTGMAFVLIQHLPPDRESMMTELLSRQTKMPVAEVEEGMSVEPDHVYMIRPGHTLTIKNGKLHLGERLERPGNNHPVDDFFRSLAEEQQERAIAIVMSGMGSNGSAGAQTIKAVGGICIAQDPETAKYPSMPKHLIDSSMADFILRPQEIPDVIIRYARHPYANALQNHAASLLRQEHQQLNEILSIIRTRHRQDFSGYKKATVLRRIQRRMGMHQVTKLGEYLKLLRLTSTEITSLADDLMVHVTGFFRDPDAWETLRKNVITPMVKDCEADAQIRCWVTACSTGEEAYTLAVLLVEAAEKINKRLDIKVFATDTAERTLAHARGGIYPAGIESEITQERLSRFFDKEEFVYRVKKELRELVVFAPQNLLQDPPFSRLDIVTCRNLLIYLEPPMQRRALALMHFGLREGGAMMLGTSETIPEGDDMFESIDQKWRIYRRIGPTRERLVEFPMPVTVDRAERKENSKAAGASPRLSLTQLVNKNLLDRFTPASVMIDRHHRIVYFHGHTERYLTNPRGEPTRDLLAIVKEPIRGAVRSALYNAIRENAPATAIAAATEKQNSRRRITVTVAPVENKQMSGYLLISFVENEELMPALTATDNEKQADQNQMMHVELGRVRDELQSTIEQLQSSNEELKASNEEIMSMNEELQSTNEELETSKEELQSLNEELTTVNSQLQIKMEELEGATNDLTSLLSSTAIAVIFLDTNFRVRRFTPAMKDFIELIPSDIGRPISDLAIKFTDPKLLQDARTVLEKLAPMETEISSHNNRWYLRRVLPYRSTEDRIGGVVITFMDISERKQAEEFLRRAKNTAEAATRAKDEFLTVLSHELRTPLSAILLWSKMLRRKPPDSPDLIEGLDAIEKSAEAQKALVEDLLDTSRITAGKLRLEMREVSLVPLLHSAVDAIMPTAQASGVHVEAQIDDDAGVVLADPERLRQVLGNLLGNAVKFTSKGGQVNVSLRRIEDDVEIRVADTGQGISQEFLPKLFSAFLQQDSSSTRRHGGLGLGLAISKQLVELHGGKIHAESEGTGRGATFVVRLPMPAISGKSSAELPADHLAETSDDSWDLDGTAILLVEDDPETRKALAKLLENTGGRVTAVSSANEALLAFKESSPSLIISDLGMADTDGCSLLRQIRELERISKRPAVPSIALTAFTRDEDRAAAMNAGFQRYLSKPIEPDVLLRSIRKLLAT